VELATAARFYFERPTGYDPKVAAKLFTPDAGARLDRLIRRLEALESFTPPALESAYRELAAALGLKLVDVAQLTRLAVTGGAASPPLFDVLAILGRDETLARLRAARAALGARAG